MAKGDTRGSTSIHLNGAETLHFTLASLDILQDLVQDKKDPVWLCWKAHVVCISCATYIRTIHEYCVCTVCMLGHRYLCDGSSVNRITDLSSMTLMLWFLISIVLSRLSSSGVDMRSQNCISLPTWRGLYSCTVLCVDSGIRASALQNIYVMLSRIPSCPSCYVRCMPWEGFLPILKSMFLMCNWKSAPYTVGKHWAAKSVMHYRDPARRSWYVDEVCHMQHTVYVQLC
jgi:hypothetical protein